VNEPPDVKKTPALRTTNGSTWLVVVGRTVLLLLAAGAVVAGWVMSRRDETGLTTKAGGKYVCPMHPEVTSDAPGDCPICHMALELGSELPRDNAMSAAPGAPGANEEASKIAESMALSPEAANLVHYSVGLVRGHVLPQALQDPAWIEESGVVSALLYQDELSALTPDEEAVFFAADRPDAGFAVRLVADLPVRWDRATYRVHYRFDSSDPAPAPGSPGWVKLANKPRRMLVVPSSAVLESAEGPYVLGYSATDRTFTKRPIEIGKVFSGFTAVVSGVREREVIVAMNAFFFDAERKLRANVDRAVGSMP
jgi:hypothetical protein